MHPDLPLDQILIGDCRELVKTLPDESVNCVVTSPPYWGLRSYGTTPQIWTNGHEPCIEHQWVTESIETGRRDFDTLPRPKGGHNKDVTVASTNRDTCSVCGAWRGELGLEPQPELYVAHLTQIFREVRRVLRSDGTIWVNLGDSYASQGGPLKAGGGINDILGGKSETQDYNRSRHVPSNFGNALYRFLEGGLIFLAGSGSLAIASKSEQVLKGDAIAPDLELSRFLGVKRILFKKRGDDFCQVLNLLDAKRDVWLSASVSFVMIDDATLEIVFNESDGIRVVVSDDDLQPTSAFGVFTVGSSAGEYSKVGLAVTEPSEPTTKVFRNIQATGDTSTFDSFGEGFLQVDAIDKAIALADAFDARSGGLRDFRVTKAGFEHLALALMGGAVELAFLSVGHLFISNKFGSLVRYGELYDKAKRMSNASQAKQLIGIPWMVARALQEDGWILRSDCIWAKPNPMPESVTDRPTKAHEYIFLLSKNPKYYYDSDAVREPMSEATKERDKSKFSGAFKGQFRGTPNEKRWQDGRPIDEPHFYNEAGRNRRTVWTVATHPFKGAHFATFPPKLIEPCILAGCPVGGVVLDPFMGSGTTASVCISLKRHYIGFDLNPAYVEGIAQDRADTTPPPLFVM